MKTLCHLWIAITSAAWLATVFFWAICISSVDAQDAVSQKTAASVAADDDNAWVTRTFRVTRHQLRSPDSPPPLPLSPSRNGIDPFDPATTSPPDVNSSNVTPFFSDDAFPLSGFPALPALDAPAATWAAHVRESSNLFEKLLRTLSIPGPEGMASLYDSATATLVVRTTAHHMKELSPYLESLHNQIPRNLVFTTEVVQAESSLIRALVEETTGKHDHTKSWGRLMELQQQGKARSLAQFRLETRSGQLVYLDSGVESTAIDSLRLDKEGRVIAIKDVSHSTVCFKVDPILSHDARNVQVNLKFDFDYAPPVERVEKIGSFGGNKTIDSPMLDYRGVRLSTDLDMNIGGRRLIGVWTPRGMPEFASGNIMQAAFLHADAPHVLPAGNPNLASLLKQHAAAPPVLAARKPEAVAADGMEVRTIPVYPNFFSNASVGKGGYSFKGWLEAQGIPFPEGASATFITPNSTLIVRNTPKALDLIECYMDFVCQMPPLLVSCTVQLVEGDGPAIRRLAEETRGISDHTAVWSQAKKLIDAGLVRVVDTWRIDGRSGQRVLFESGDDRRSTGEVAFAESTSDEESKSETKDAGTSAKPPDATAQPRSSSVVTIQNEVRMVGAQFEMDPTISTDRETVVLNYVLMHHYAPPIIQENLSQIGQTVPAGSQTTNFHGVRFVSTGTFFSGTTRMVGIWKPEGSASYDGKDIMQVAFLKVNLVPWEPTER